MKDSLHCSLSTTEEQLNVNTASSPMISCMKSWTRKLDNYKFQNIVIRNEVIILPDGHVLIDKVPIPPQSSTVLTPSNPTKDGKICYHSSHTTTHHAYYTITKAHFTHSIVSSNACVLHDLAEDITLPTWIVFRLRTLQIVSKTNPFNVHNKTL